MGQALEEAQAEQDVLLVAFAQIEGAEEHEWTEETEETEGTEESEGDDNVG